MMPPLREETEGTGRGRLFKNASFPFQAPLPHLRARQEKHCPNALWDAETRYRTLFVKASILFARVLRKKKGGIIKMET